MSKTPHVRDLRPAEPELMSTDDLPFLQLHERKGKQLTALDEYVSIDPATGKAVKGPKPPEPKMVPTGSMKATDLACSDCGHDLVAGHGQKFYYMVCSRLDSRDPRFIEYEREFEEERPNFGLTIVRRIVREQIADAPKPTPNSVIECGRYGLP